MHGKCGTITCFYNWKINVAPFGSTFGEITIRDSGSLEPKSRAKKKDFKIFVLPFGTLKIYYLFL